MIVLSQSLWLTQTNTYVLAREEGGPAVVIDAPPGSAEVLDLLSQADLKPVALLLTHGHVDHMGGSGLLVASARIRAYVHPDDDFLTLDPTAQLRLLFGTAPPGDFAPPSELSHLKDGDTLELGGMTIDVLHTPGHTPGHCCFHVGGEGLLLSGDQLFAGSIGRTDLPGGNTAALAVSMREKVMPFPDDTRVLPGHGAETTIGRERLGNPFRHLWA